MQLQESLKKIYRLLSNDEILLRLLHYIPKNAKDNPLDPTKTDICSLPPLDKKEILDSVLIPSDKTYDLQLATKICRICFYTGTRQPLSNYSKSTRALTDNPYASEQKYNFDVYVHVDVDIMDFRINAILDRLNEILLLEKVTDVGDYVLDFISPIMNTPDGFLGLKAVYKTVSLQEGSERKWK